MDCRRLLVAALPIVAVVLSGCGGAAEQEDAVSSGQDQLKSIDVGAFARQLGLGNPIGTATRQGDRTIRTYDSRTYDGRSAVSTITSDAADLTVLAVLINNVLTLDGVALEAAWTYGLSGFQGFEEPISSRLARFRNGSILVADREDSRGKEDMRTPTTLGSSFGVVASVGAKGGSINRDALWLSYRYRTRLGKFVRFIGGPDMYLSPSVTRGVTSYEYEGGSIAVLSTPDSDAYTARIKSAGTDAEIPVETCTRNWVFAPGRMSSTYTCELR